MKAVNVRVTGRVQGVSFRYYAQAEADRLGVSGWVRNEPDGTVAMYAEGPDEAVDALVQWCRRGPTTARVADVATRAAEPTGARGFEVRY
jgi:acylphosphatase